MMVHSAIEISLSNGPLATMIDAYLFFASALCALLKHINLYYHDDNLFDCLSSFYTDYENVKNQLYIKLMNNYTKIHKYLYLLYMTSGYFGVMMFLLRPIIMNLLYVHENQDNIEALNNYKKQTIINFSFLSKDFVDHYYYLILTFQYFQFVYACTSGGGCDCYFFALVSHLSGQFELLKHDFQDMKFVIPVGNKKKSTKLTVKELFKKQKEKINSLIDRHIYLLNLGNKIEESFNFIVLMQLITSIIMICMCGKHNFSFLLIINC